MERELIGSANMAFFGTLDKEQGAIGLIKLHFEAELHSTVLCVGQSNVILHMSTASTKFQPGTNCLLARSTAQAT